MLISIVIPVYNSELFLEKCLNSIINQSYENIEIIIVNDGSTDNSKRILQKYEKTYANISLYNKKNTGVSDTRNIGINHTHGDYVMFVDADDWIDEDYVMKSVAYLKNNPADLLLLPYVREYEKKSVKNYLFKTSSVKFTDKQEVQKGLLLKLFGPIGEELRRPAYIDDLSPCWGKMYKRDICKNIKFEDTYKIGAEDIWFNIEYAYEIKSVAYINNTFYHYNKENQNSLIHKNKSDIFKKRDKLYTAMSNFINKKSLSKDYRIALDNRIIIDLIGISNNIYSSQFSFIYKYKEERRILNNNIYQKAFKTFDFSFLPLRWRVFFKLCENKQVLLLSILTTVGEKMKPLLK